MKTDNEILNTRKIFCADSLTVSVKLSVGCLVLAMTFAVSTIQARVFAERSEANSMEVSTTEVPAENLHDKISELGGEDDQLPGVERPGKPDSHNSNGDDVMVRPPR